MHIAVIGSGNIGSRLAQGWARAGHRIYLGSRDPANERVQSLCVPDQISAHTVAEAAAAPDVQAIAIAVSGSAAALGVIQELSKIENIEERVIMDTMNTMFEPKAAEILGHPSVSAAIAAGLGSRRVVKILNNTGAENLEQPLYGDQRIDTFYCTDDPAAGEVARKLAEDLGLHAWSAGGLGQAPLLENFAALWVRLAIQEGHGRDIAFKLLKR